MEDRQKYIAKLEEDASRLVDELGVLKQEVASYRTAAVELTRTREALAAFLEKTHALTQATHKLLATMNEIGSAAVFAQLKSIRGTAEENKRRATAANVLIIVGAVVIVAFQMLLLAKLRAMK